MRSLSSLILAGLVAGATGCTSSLWGPFVQDTDASCNVTPCPTGQTCNPTTGLCEGGSPDLGGDLGNKTPVLGEPVSIFSDPSASYFYMAVGDLQGGSEPELFLAGFDAGSFKILNSIASSSDKYKTISLSAFTGLDPTQGATFAISYPFPVETPAGVLVTTAALPTGSGSGKLYYIKKQSNNAAVAASASTLPGYKLLAVGYLTENNAQGIMVTSSKAQLIADSLGSSFGSTGAIEGFVLGSNGTQLNSQSAVTGNYSLASPPFQMTRDGKFPVNVALASPSSPPVQVAAYNSGSLGNKQTVAAAPATDFAIPADMDGDGNLDLVLGKTVEKSGTLGSVTVLINSGTNAAPVFEMTNPRNFHQQDIAQTMTNMYVDDLDLDGYPDIALGLYLSKTVVVFHNEPSSVVQGARVYNQVKALIGSSVGARSVQFADLDGDGCRDVVALFGGQINAEGTEIMIARGHRNERTGTTCP